MRRILRGGGLCALTSLLACTHPDRASRIDASLVARTEEHIAAREYRASANARGLQAPNRAHDLRTWFAKTGIRVHDRTTSDSPELLQLSLAGVGRGPSLAAVAPGEVIADRNRVEIRRPGIVEWYVNSAVGLEQGFTLSERPPGEGVLVLEIAVAGARVSLCGDAVIFESAGRELRYGELAVVDAAGSEVPAHFELASADRLRIVAVDARAGYPIVIDPLLTGTADTQIDSDQDNARLGASVASLGDVNGDGYADVIVGAPYFDTGPGLGAAFVFHGSASGIASGNQASADAALESDQAGSGFGSSVASAGDVNGDGHRDVIVGAPWYDLGQSDEGVAFVFHGSAAGIAAGTPASASARLESDQPTASLGWSVASAGDIDADGYDDVIIGAPYYDAGEGFREGAAFVFHGSAAGIASGTVSTAATQLESNQSAGGEYDYAPDFGASVAGAGDVNADGYDDVIVGAPFYNAGQIDEGAAFVFMGSASGIADTDLSSPGVAQLESNVSDGRLGLCVASAGDVNGDGRDDVIVAALRNDAGLGTGAGFVFHAGPSGIADGSLTAAAQLEAEQFGGLDLISVASSGDVNDDGYDDVIVGAPYYVAGGLIKGGGLRVPGRRIRRRAGQSRERRRADRFESSVFPPRRERRFE